MDWVVAPQYTSISTPRTSDCDLIWKKVFVDVIKLRILRWEIHPGFAGWVLNPKTSVLTRESEEKTQRRGEAMWRQGQRLEWCSHQPRTPGTTRSWRGEQSVTLTEFRGSEPLPGSGFQTSGLQNCERMCFCGYKPLSLWYVAIATLGNQYTILRPEVPND